MSKAAAPTVWLPTGSGLLAGRFVARLCVGLLFCVVTAALASAHGCSKSSSRSADGAHGKISKDDAEELDIAQKLVRSFFKAVDEDDCRLIIENFTTGATMADCEEFVREWKGHSLKLIEILEATKDGRNPRAIIVRTRVQGRKGTKISLVRVVLNKGHWSIRL